MTNAKEKKVEIFICGQCFGVYSFENEGKKIIRNQNGVLDFRSPDYSLRFEKKCPKCRADQIAERARSFADQSDGDLNLL